MTEPFTIRFLPEGRAYAAADEISLAVAAAACDVLIEQPCGAQAHCGKCRVRVVEGACEPTATDRLLIWPEDLAQGWRLACRLVLEADAVVDVPPTARAVVPKGFGPESLIPSDAPRAVVRRTVTIAAHHSAMAPEAERLLSEVGPDLNSSLALAVIRQLARLTALGRSPVSVVSDGGTIVAIEDAELAGRMYGLAFDVGSTTVAGALVDLETGQVAGESSELNPQVAYGADVISRIHYAQSYQGGLEKLRAALTGALRRIASRSLEAAQVKPAAVYSVTVVGNPTMIHSLLGVDLTSLGRAPYDSAWTAGLTLNTAALDLAINESALVHVVPMIRSHVGSDAVAAMLATGLDRGPGWRLLLDLGTNSEVALANGDRILVASTSAGPAFEGTVIHHGCRAAPGAVDAVYVASNGRITATTIGNRPAIGLCGTGLIDAVAELLRVGAISPSGFLRDGLDSNGNQPEVSLRFTTVDSQRAVILAEAERTNSREPLLLTAGDVRQLQLVKASTFAAMTILCRRAGIGFEDLEEVVIAGAFGNMLRKGSAVSVGLVPQVDPEIVRFVGNAAGAGARMLLVDSRARERAERIRQIAEYCELATDTDYSELFCEAMRFPEPT